MQRTPFQSPQTSMERRIADCIKHLEHGVDSCSGFAQTVERAMSHAFWLEAECTRLREEKQEWEKSFTVALPTFSASWKEPQIVPNVRHSFTWELEAVRWIGVLHPHQARAEIKTWLRMRRLAYKQLIKRMRVQFERTFPKTP